MVLRVPQTSNTDITWELVRRANLVLLDQELGGEGGAEVQPLVFQQALPVIVMNAELWEPHFFMRDKEFKYKV